MTEEKSKPHLVRQTVRRFVAGSMDSKRKWTCGIRSDIPGYALKGSAIGIGNSPREAYEQFKSMEACL